MINRIKNLWSWSALDPNVLGKDTGTTIAEVLKRESAQIVYPNRTQEILATKPDATLDDLI